MGNTFQFIVISKRIILYLSVFDLNSHPKTLDLLLFGRRLVGCKKQAAQCLKIFKVKNLCLPTCTYKHLTQYSYFLIGCFNKLFQRLEKKKKKKKKKVPALIPLL